jgi:hypothetical protein
MMRALDVVYVDRLQGNTDAATAAAVGGDSHTGSGFDVLNEFSGLRGTFPIGDKLVERYRTFEVFLPLTRPLFPLIFTPYPQDAAVYFNGALVALVEIDGEFHYKVCCSVFCDLIHSTSFYQPHTLRRAMHGHNAWRLKTNLCPYLPIR